MKWRAIWIWLILVFISGCQQPKLPEAVQPTAATESFLDTEDLLTARLALSQHLHQVEGITAVPLPNDWTPQHSTTSSELHTYTFTHTNWQLDMTQPQPPDGQLWYRIQVTGPDNFIYAADILRDGLVVSAQ